MKYAAGCPFRPLWRRTFQTEGGHRVRSAKGHQPTSAATSNVLSSSARKPCRLQAEASKKWFRSY
jgi:hypothetical protein